MAMVRVPVAKRRTRNRDMSSIGVRDRRSQRTNPVSRAAASDEGRHHEGVGPSPARGPR